MTADQDPGIVPQAVERATRSPDSTLAPPVDASLSTAAGDVRTPRPDIERTKDAVAGPRSRSIEATILTSLALLYTLYFAREFLIPIIFALLLNFLLSPLIRRLVRVGLKAPIGAALVVLVLIFAVA